MNTDELITEDLVRETFAHQADQAPSGARILASLPARRTRRMRTRLTFTGLAMVGAVAAATIPAVLVQQNSGTQPGAASTASPFGMKVREPYRPGWLPEGLTERTRSVGGLDQAGGSEYYQQQVSSWSSADPVNGVIGSPGVSLVVNPVHSPHPEDQAVEINGKPGTLRETGKQMAWVTWRPRGDVLVEVRVTDLPGSRDLALKVARSVVPDPGANLDPGLEFRWLPDHLRVGYAQVTSKGTSPGTVQVQTASPGTEPHAVSATLGVEVQKWVSDGEGLTVRGRPARYSRAKTGNQFLAVDLGDGRWLIVNSNSRTEQGRSLTREQLVKITEEVGISPNPDRSWLGTR